jgi:hypothetical protein
MKEIKNLLVGVFVGIGLIVGLHLLHAQETAMPVQSGTVSTVDWNTASDLQVMLQAVEMMPETSADSLPRSGTFYSAQHAPGSAQPWPPLPSGFGLPAWSLGDGFYLLDDQAVDYSLSISSRMAGGMTMMMDEGGGMLPPGYSGAYSGGDTNVFYSDSFNFNPDYGTNLWIAQVNVASNYFSGIVSNSVADIQYELQYTPDLAQPWQSAGWFVYGSEATNWTPFNVPANSPTNFFLRVRSWADDGSGLPLWWQKQYFGTNGVDPYGDPAGDGWNNLQKFQNGMNPNVFYTPPAPQGMAVSFNPSNNVAKINWSPSPGPVTGYTVEKTDSYAGTTQDFNVSTMSFQDNTSGDMPDPWNGNVLDVSYRVQAHYSGGGSAWSTLTSLQQPTVSGSIVPGLNGTTVLAVSGLPMDAATVRLVYWDFMAWEAYGDSSYYSYVDVPVSSFTNGQFTLPPALQTAGMDAYGYPIELDYLQSVEADGDTSAQNWINNESSGQPFYDGRRQLKQNLIFELRAASQNLPFGFDYKSDDFSSIYYAWSGLYRPNNDLTGCGDRYFGRDIFGPFEDNYLYRNFVFTLADVTTAGLPTTGAHAYPLDGMQLINPFYQFDGSTNEMANSMLATNQTRWQYSEWEVDQSSVIVQNYPNYSMANNASNFYGLPFVSAKLAYLTSGGLATNMLSPGGNVTLSSPLSGATIYPETAQPQFQTVEYDFWNPPSSACGVPPGTRLVPGMAGFSPTNQSQSLIMPVGSSISLVGYAKLAITNGYPGIFAYLGQYFDKACQMDANNNATTNSAGILSPYGDFFPTVPGPAALLTMPDVDTGQRGTGVVYCASMDVDKNHDGVMDLSWNGPDATSQSSPDVVWVNNGYDGATGDAPVIGGTPPNYSLGVITVPRDLENFFRLWVCGLPALPANQNYAVTLSWNVVSGNPGINLYNSVENNGGIGYLTDTNVALQQSTVTNIATGYGSSPYYVGPGATIARITNGATFTFPASYFTNNANKHFLFEGAGIGEGELTMTISQNGNTIVQTGVWLDLHDIKDFYELARATNVTSSLPPSGLVSQLQVIRTVPAAPDESKQIVVFVHGINNTDFAAQDSTEIIFKRLYWSGYHGRVAEFKWPCAFLPFDNTLNPFNFDLGEFYAWKSAAAFKDYLGYLTNRFAGYQIDILAHSQGNIVASEAIKQGAPFDNYILSQGAVPAHCYDTGVTFQQKFLDAESSSPTPLYTANGGYHGYFVNLTGNLINFYNTNDFALAKGTWHGLLANWEQDQISQKPDSFGYRLGQEYAYYPSSQRSIASYTFSEYDVTDPQEIMSMVARSRTRAIGAEDAAAGVINTNASVDLRISFGFGNTRDEHSAQFTRPIQSVLGYYQTILNRIALPQ